MKRCLSPVVIFFLLIPFFVLSMDGCSEEESFKIIKGTDIASEEDKRVPDKSSEEEVSVTGDETEGKVTIRKKNGESTILYNRGKVSADFPKDVSIYIPSQVKISQIMDNGKNIMASLHTEDPAQKVAEFYKKALPQSGWKIEGEMNMGNTYLLQGEKADKELTVTVTIEQGKTAIALVIAEK